MSSNAVTLQYFCFGSNSYNQPLAIHLDLFAANNRWLIFESPVDGLFACAAEVLNSKSCCDFCDAVILCGFFLVKSSAL